MSHTTRRRSRERFHQQQEARFTEFNARRHLRADLFALHPYCDHCGAELHQLDPQDRRYACMPKSADRLHCRDCMPVIAQAARLQNGGAA